MKKHLLIGIVLSCMASLMQAQVSLPPVFADNMVLQQKSDAALWGKSEPNAKIIITTTWSGGRTIVNADSEGKWFTRISTPSAGGPYEITFNDGKKLTLKNVLIGEVWICSGQSNMEMPMRGYPGQPVDGAIDYIIGAKPSVPIRSCKVMKQISLEPKDECDAVWREDTPEAVAKTSATAYFFAKRLNEVLGVPVGIINVSWGGSPIQSWLSRDVLESQFSEDVDLTHYKNGRLPDKHPHHSPGVLYNGMLGTIIPFTARGFLWYQGCSDCHRFKLYERLQPAFTSMLREDWGNADMPFYFVQIAPYRYSGPDGRDGAFFRWAQAKTLEKIPNSGMVVTLDAGDINCIHPAGKKTVGDRLAYLALVNDYGLKGISSQDVRTPMPSGFEFKNGAAFVTFDCGDRGMGPINVELDGFELAGKDKVFYPAKAKVSDNRKSIKVFCPEVTEPVAVRYAMKNNSEATLFNNYGIPASPFRSDEWDQ